VLHAGTGSPLRDLLGPHSLLGIDEVAHLEQRKLLLPPFKGDRMKRYESMIAQIAAEEIDSWPAEVEFATNRPLQRITLRAILRAVFGADGPRLRALEQLLPPWTRLGNQVALAIWLRRNYGPWSPWPRFQRLRARIDVVLDELITIARTDDHLSERADVLALMVQARHVDGTRMSDAEIRDQLVTMLVAGHETTAHTLSWAIERLRRHPDVLARLVAEAQSGGKMLRQATIREVQRCRPVVPFAGRLVWRPYELGGYPLPVGTRLLVAACLTHYDPALFPDPHHFHPDRFLSTPPERHTRGFRSAAASVAAWVPASPIWKWTSSCESCLSASNWSPPRRPTRPGPFRASSGPRPAAAAPSSGDRRPVRLPQRRQRASRALV
jgi:cytochrome P450 family 138